MGARNTLGPKLLDKGYCVYALDYGKVSPVSDLPTPIGAVAAVGPVDKSAEQLKVFIDGILAATGARKVDIVGHSQGGMMPRYYLTYLGGAKNVGKLVGLAPSNHGADAEKLMKTPVIGPFIEPAVGVLAWQLQALKDQKPGSAFLKKLEGHDVEPGVTYTVITSINDQVVNPENSRLKGEEVTNISLQDGCPNDVSGHMGIGFDDRAHALVLNALNPKRPANVPCPKGPGDMGILQPAGDLGY